MYPLDGGRIVKGILHIFLGKMKAEKYTNCISFVTLILITCFCLTGCSYIELNDLAIACVVKSYSCATLVAKKLASSIN